MNILAFEFSSPQRSVAVVQTPASRGPSAVEIIETGPLSNQALGMCEEALRQAGLEREQIDCVAIGLGPGSYTGIRAAIALAQGWQLARAVQLLGLSSAECIAAQAQADGLTGTVAVVVDAQRGEFYLAEYELSPGCRRELKPLRLATRAEVEQRQAAGAVVIGPEVAKWFSGSRLLFPRAARLGHLGAGRTDFLAGERLEPIYLRQTTFVKAPPPRVLPD